MKVLKQLAISILLLCALGALCYGFYFKCVDWFEKI